MFLTNCGDPSSSADENGGLSRNSAHYSFPLSSLGRACLIRPRSATNPSPGPRRLVKTPSRSTLSPPLGRGQTHFAMRSVSDTTDSVLRLSSLRMTRLGCAPCLRHSNFRVRAKGLSCGGEPWRNSRVRAQLVRASESNHVPFSNVSKNLNRTAAGRTGLDVHPLGRPSSASAILSQENGPFALASVYREPCAVIAHW